MSMFAAYGLLTASMIAMALVATLLVLLSLLLVVSQDAATIDTASLDHPLPVS